MSERNNMDRLGVDMPQSIHFNANNNGNTEFVTLPSGGKFYKNEKLKTGSIEIYLMVSRHEDILSNKSYFLEGVIIDKLLKSLIVDPTITTDELSPIDAGAIILAARNTAYGPNFRSEIQCPECNKKHTVNVSLEADLTVLGGKDSERYESLLTEEGDIKITLPRSKKTVVCRQFNKQVEKELLKIMASKKTVTKNGKAVAENAEMILNNSEYLSCIVKKYDDVESQEKIKIELENMGLLDIRYLKAAYKDTSARYVVKKEVRCSCGWEDEVEVGIMTPDFFWPEL